MSRWAQPLLGVSAALLLAVAAAPVAVLWGPPALRYHVYRELSFQVIADEAFADADQPEEVVQAAMQYLNRHLWVFSDSHPYDGKAFEYLVEGVGWCDYYAKLFCELLATRGLHARYAFLKDQSGESPHTVAEVRLGGRWRAVDPFFNMRFTRNTGEWVGLEEITPELVEQLRTVQIFRTMNPRAFENISEIARRTFPLPMPPKRSDDFVEDKNVFDGEIAAYFRLLGRPFAHWYQDRFLERRLADMEDPLARLWYTARNYHLYQRCDKAEPLYRELLARDAQGRYTERATLFLGRLLLRQERYEEARDVLERYVRMRPDHPWARFHLGRCYEGLGLFARAAAQYRSYQQLHGRKFSIEAIRRLTRFGVWT